MIFFKEHKGLIAKEKWNESKLVFSPRIGVHKSLDHLSKNQKNSIKKKIQASFYNHPESKKIKDMFVKEKGLTLLQKNLHRL